MKNKVIHFFLFGLAALFTFSFVGLRSSPVAMQAQESLKYIADRLDNRYVTQSKNPDEVAYLTVKNTYISGSELKTRGESLEDYFDEVHQGDYIDGYVMTSVIKIPLYDFDETSEYVVGRIETDEDNEIKDLIFAENNDEGNVLKGEYFDKENNIVYIRKTDLYKITNDGIFTDHVQVQALRKYIRGRKNKIRVTVSENGGVRREDIYVSPVSAFTEIPADIIGSGDLSEKNLIIRINGSEMPLDKEAYDIREESLVLKVGAANISEINVDIAEKKGLLLIDTAYGYSTGTDSSGAFPVWKGSVKVGDYCEFTGSWKNDSGKNDVPSTYNALQVISGNALSVQEDFYEKLISKDPSAVQWITGEYAAGKPNIYKPSSGAANTYRDYKIKAGSISAVAASSDNAYFPQWLDSISCTVSMSCAEVRTAASVGEGNILFSAVVSEVGSDYILITFCSHQRTEGKSSNAGKGQVLCGTYAIRYEPEYAIINYYANKGSTKAPYSILSSGLLCKNGSIVNDNWKVGLTKSAGLLNADDLNLFREGYVFSGYWNTKPDGSGTGYHEDDRRVSFNEKGSINLYAIWIRKTAKVIFDTNGGAWGREDMNCEYETDYKNAFCIPVLTIADEPKMDGYAFMGWSRDGKTAEYDFGDLLKEANTEAENITLYAVWQKASQKDAVWSEYGRAQTFISSDIMNDQIKTIPPAKHHYYAFEGYFTPEGEQVTDENGRLADKDVAGIIGSGTYENTEDMILIAKFKEPEI